MEGNVIYQDSQFPLTDFCNVFRTVVKLMMRETFFVVTFQAHKVTSSLITTSCFCASAAWL